MLKDIIQRSIKRIEEHPIGMAYAVTLLYIAFMSHWLTPAFQNDSQFAEGYYGIRLNLVGDFLAGVFAPVACFWFIMSMFQTSRALKLQQAEFQKTSQAIELQVEATKLQADEVRNSIKEMQAAHETAKANALHIQKDVFLTEEKIIKEELHSYMKLLLDEYYAISSTYIYNRNNLGYIKDKFITDNPNTDKISNINKMWKQEKSEEFIIASMMLRDALETVKPHWYMEHDISVIASRFDTRCNRLLEQAAKVDSDLYEHYLQSDIGQIHLSIKSALVKLARTPPSPL